MRRCRVFAIVVCIMYFMVSIQALAFPLTNTFKDDQGRSHRVGVFHIAKHRDDAFNGNRKVYEFWVKFRTLSRSIVMCSMDSMGSCDYAFYVVLIDVTATLTKTSGAKIELKFTHVNGSTVNIPYAYFIKNTDVGSDYYFYNFNVSNISTYTSIVAGKYFESNSLSGFTSHVVAEYDGNEIRFIDDLGDRPEGILECLKSFWIKLKSILVTISGNFDYRFK